MAQITAVDLHINISRPDSQSFRINFYRFDNDENRPAERLVEKHIVQRHAIREGWLKFDLKEYNILVKGNVFVSVEFIPETREDIRQILYEVKIGGSSKSFYRKNSLGSWNSPPHHYCIYATALVDKTTPDDVEEDESVPAFAVMSEITGEPYSIFVRLPEGYNRNRRKKYPVIYHVDGNAYFDMISASLERLNRRRRLSRDVILVGIGYENAYVMDSLRNRDYTFPEALPADSFPVSGGGEKFYNFIKSDLIPRIEATYRTDTTSRTLMGHSLGGYFALYALSMETESDSLFHNFVAASPSISYYDCYLYKKFSGFSPGVKDGHRFKLFLTVGELEIAEDTTGDFKILEQALSRNAHIQMQFKMYKDLEHMGTAVPSFEDGIEYVFSGDR